ncbi:MAG: phosphotransferase family protein [Nocardioides sp.]|nr:phosphotransferase family protein [Nocardioides sp.]
MSHDPSPMPALRPWLARKWSEDVEEDLLELKIEQVSRPKVGQSNETVLFTATATRTDGHRLREDLVLRVQPPPDGIFDEPDVVREARVLQGLDRAAGVPVPRVRWVEPASDLLGRPFFVMAQVPGRVPGAKPSIHSAGWLPTLSADERRTLWDSAMDTLVAVHQTDWRSDLDFLRQGGDADHLAAHLRRLTGWYENTVRGRAYPITDAALRWLHEGLPNLTPSESVLVWGDARVGNMLFGPDHRVAAALDWEVATVGPAQIDVAHWLVFDEFATVSTPALDGFPDKEASIEAYVSRSGRPLPDLDYYEVLQCFFLATTLIRQTDARVRVGDLDPSTTMGHGNVVTVLLARRLGLTAPEISADYHRHRQDPAEQKEQPS